MAWKLAVAPTPPKEPEVVFRKVELETARARREKRAPPAELAWQSAKLLPETDTSREEATAPPTMRKL